MKYQLINPPISGLPAIDQILVNRGIKISETKHYLNTTDDDINDFRLLGEDKLEAAAQIIDKSQKAVVIVDCDDDGFTSAAILMNYLWWIKPTWIERKVDYLLHDGKEHGLADCMQKILNGGYDLVLIPDAGSNDNKYCSILKENGMNIVILDHHETEEPPADAIVINNQICDYPNKNLSGAGVVYQFCRYLDYKLNIEEADLYLDLVALGLVGDMMSLRDFETKHLITKGFDTSRISNPFIQEMWKRNYYKLGDIITSWGATFYIVPLINAIVRSGTQDEKKLVFESMLDFKGSQEVPSTKRGHKFGEKETIAEQAVRVCANVKNRQNKTIDKGMCVIDEIINSENLTENKVLLILLEPGIIDKNIAGLSANRLANQYQRPCCVLTYCENNCYQGSARGYEKAGVSDFKKICTDTGMVEFAAGHANAFGVSIAASNIDTFLQKTNESLKEINNESVYYVDYIFQNEAPASIILEIARMRDWGKDMDEPLIAIEGLKVTKDMVTLMSPDKNPTLKIQMRGGVSIIKFGIEEEDYHKLSPEEGCVYVNLVGKCNMNEWNDRITAQIFLEDYEITEYQKYFF